MILQLSSPRNVTITNSARAFLDFLALEYSALISHDVDRRRKLKGWARTWMNHHQTPRLDDDQAERCDGNLPFAGRLMAVLSMTGHWAGQVLSRAEFHFPAVAQNGGFWSKNVENALSFNES
jgi:hypothetical protein